MTRSDESVKRSPISAVALHTKTPSGWEEWQETRARADGVNWLNNPSGAAIAIPAGAKTIIIRPIASNAYFRFGNSAVTAAAPSGAVSDGSGSRFLFEGEAIMVAVDTATHYAVSATGFVEVVWWLS